MEEIKVTEKTVDMLRNRYGWKCSRCGKEPEVGEVWLRSSRGATKYCPKCAEEVFLDLPDIDDEELESLEVGFMPLEVIVRWADRKRR